MSTALYETAWLALACWAACHWMPSFSLSRLLWTVGALVNLGHVLLAFHVIHAWDPERAYNAIARQTYEQTGIDTGVGLYINYAFTGLWLIVAIWWWLFPQSYNRRSLWLDGVLQFLFVFMFFNATVVFGRSSIRLLGAGFCLLGALGWFHAARASTRSRPFTLQN